MAPKISDEKKDSSSLSKAFKYAYKLLMQNNKPETTRNDKETQNTVKEPEITRNYKEDIVDARKQARTGKNEQIYFDCVVLSCKDFVEKTNSMENDDKHRAYVAIAAAIPELFMDIHHGRVNLDEPQRVNFQETVTQFFNDAKNEEIFLIRSSHIDGTQEKFDLSDLKQVLKKGGMNDFRIDTVMESPGGGCMRVCYASTIVRGEMDLRFQRSDFQDNTSALGIKR